jgi:hypothetical protein
MPYRDLEEKRKWQRDYIRQHTVKTKKGWIYGVNKRPYSNHCEICGIEKKKLDYHHWNDNNVELGIWVCIWCHRIVEAVESGKIFEIIKKYEQLKAEVTKQT